MENFDPLSPFKNKKFLEEVYTGFRNFKFKLYKIVDVKLMEKPSDTEFDLNLGKVHFTEKDFLGLSKIVKKINKKWGTKITYCIFTSDKTGRDVLMNIRSPRTPLGFD